MIDISQPAAVWLRNSRPVRLEAHHPRLSGAVDGVPAEGQVAGQVARLGADVGPLVAVQVDAGNGGQDVAAPVPPRRPLPSAARRAPGRCPRRCRTTRRRCGRRRVGALSDPVRRDGNSSAAAAARGPAGRPASTARADRARPSRSRTARASSGTASCWPGRDGRRPPVRVRWRLVPSRPISRSVAMLSLAEIICCAASRTETWEPGGSSSKPDEPTALASSVMVSVSVQASVPALTASATASSTYSLKIDASGSDRSVLVPATLTHLPSVDLGDLVRVARARTSSAAVVDVGPLVDHRRLERHVEAVDQAGVVGAQRRCPGRRRRRSARAAWPGRRRCRPR